LSAARPRVSDASIGKLHVVIRTLPILVPEQLASELEVVAAP
jgi:hypothetical protein